MKGTIQQVGGVLLLALAAASLGSQVDGQIVQPANGVRLSTEDFLPYVLEPRVLLDAGSREGASRTWEPRRSASEWFLSIDPEGNVVVPARKRQVEGTSGLKLLRFNTRGELIDVLPHSHSQQLPTGQVDSLGKPALANFSFELGSHFPLVRDVQGGTTRLLSTSSSPILGPSVMAVRTLGERITVLNSGASLASRLGTASLSLASFSYGPIEYWHGIRHANGAWAAQYSANNSYGFVLNLDVPANGPPSPDGRSVAFVRNTDRVMDGGTWTEFSRSRSIPSEFDDWRFASSGRAAFMMTSPRYTTTVRPSNAATARTLWTAAPTGQLTLVARELISGESAFAGTSANIFRSLEPFSIAINASGQIAFLSAQGQARDAAPIAGIFLHAGQAPARVLSAGDLLRSGPGQDPPEVSVVSSIPTAQRLQLNDRGDLLAVVRLQDQAANSIAVRLAEPDRQSGLDGWIRVAGPGDRLLNAPRWKLASISNADLSNRLASNASLNIRGQVLMMAMIQEPFGLRIPAVVSFDLRSGLNLVWADNQPVRNASTQALSQFEFFVGSAGASNWNATNAGFAERFNDVGQFTVYATQVRPFGTSASTRSLTALLFTIKQAANRADLGSFEYPLMADGVIDSNDIAAFTQLFFDDSRRADLNDDGVLDGLDVQRMVEFVSDAGR